MIYLIQVPVVQYVQLQNMSSDYSKSIDLIKKWEGLKLKAYRCPAGLPTIGYGTRYYKDGVEVKMGDSITLAQAEDLLNFRILQIAEFIHNDLKEVELNDNQRNALISFIFNIGIERFKRNTTIRKLLKDGNVEGAAKQFVRWNKVKGVPVRGLTLRRIEETELFNSTTNEQIIH